MKFLSAAEARKQSQESVENLNNKILSHIFENGILPAIKEGRMTCSIKYGNTSIPTYIIDLLRSKGYSVQYGESYNQRDGNYVDHTRLEISWKE